MSIAAEVQRIREIFGPGTDIRVPPFQRAYAWEDEEVEVLIQDLLEAFRTGTVYFLGAIVVIRPRNRGPSDVVDGQQRLTTLTIMMSVLRDLARTKDEEALLQSMIGPDVKAGGMRFQSAQSQKWRITLNPNDEPYFRRFVQESGATLQDEMRARARLCAGIGKPGAPQCGCRDHARASLRHGAGGADAVCDVAAGPGDAGARARRRVRRSRTRCSSR